MVFALKKSKKGYYFVLLDSDGQTLMESPPHKQKATASQAMYFLNKFLRVVVVDETYKRNKDE